MAESNFEKLKRFEWINCICCGKIIKHMRAGDEEIPFDEYIEKYLNSPTTPEKYNPQNMMWRDGIILEGSAGYGSNHDGDMFYVGICDSCMTDNLNNGRIRPYGNYMLNVLNKTELEKQERMRNRSKNLDDLTSEE